jgi:hypothetical protein
LAYFYGIFPFAGLECNSVHFFGNFFNGDLAVTVMVRALV